MTQNPETAGPPVESETARPAVGPTPGVPIPSEELPEVARRLRDVEAELAEQRPRRLATSDPATPPPPAPDPRDLSTEMLAGGDAPAG